MSLTNTPASERTHIGFFGCTNSGKSSLVNAITSQDLSIVSDIKGTTTDVVKKTMEILPLGAVVIIDTAGIDDKTSLGKLRIEKTLDVLKQTDIAVLVVDSTVGLKDEDKNLTEKFKKKNIPYIIAYNKSDLINNKEFVINNNEIYVSAKNNKNINELKNMLANLIKKENKVIIADKLERNDIVVLVTPIDESAPKGRLILPQQLVLRELLDYHCIPICTQVEELDFVLKKIQNPKLVITDSQVFKEVEQIVPQNITLTSFSILMARYKGELSTLTDGIKYTDSLKEGDKILISEGCTHHRQCNDIGTVKIPKLLQKYTNKTFDFEFTSGGEFPKDLSKYSLVIHCGGCMLNEAEMKSRIEFCKLQNVPVVNYGILMAHINGILNRSTEILK